MAHIALIITGLTGRLNSSFKLATRLQTEGHTVTYLCPIDVREKVENLAFNYIQLRPINFNYSHADLKEIQSSSWIKKFLYHIKNRKNHYKKGVEILNLEEYKSELKKLNPDHIIIDMELHDLIFTAYSLDIPLTLFTAWFSNRMGLGIDLPPLRTGIIPKKGFNGNSISILSSWIFIKFKVQARIIVDKLNFKGYRRFVLKKYAKTNNFPVNSLISTNLPYFFCYTNLPILSFTLSEMDFPHKPAKNHIYIGPMVYEKRESKFDNDTINLIDKLIDEKQNTKKKLIYFSAGSILKPDIEFVKKIMNAIKDKEQWMLIISLGGKLNKEAFEAQSNCVFIPWVPQLKVLQHADCCITHAGINTINECLHYSVPMLVYSCNEADENGNAARIHYHQLGIMRNKNNDSSKEIKENLEKILSDKIYTENLNKFNKIYLNYQQKNLSKILKLKS